jgi:hypothetical protein
MCRRLSQIAFPVLFTDPIGALPADLVESVQAGFCFRDKILVHRGFTQEVCPEDLHEIIFDTVGHYFQCKSDQLPFTVNPVYSTLDVSSFPPQQQIAIKEELESVLRHFRLPYSRTPTYTVYRHSESGCQSISIEIDATNCFKALSSQHHDGNVAIIEISPEASYAEPGFMRAHPDDLAWIATMYLLLQREITLHDNHNNL